MGCKKPLHQRKQGESQGGVFQDLFPEREKNAEQISVQQRIGACELHFPEILCRLHRRVIAEGSWEQREVSGRKKQTDQKP